MKRIQLVLIAALLIASASFAQDKDKNKQKGQPAAGQQQQQQQGAPNAKQAKTKEEYAAYNKAVALTDPAQLEAAANDFVQKFPDSELKGFLFVRAAEMYQGTGNSEKTLELGRKALEYQPNEAVINAMMASELAEKTKETDLDRDERLAECVKYAQAALANVDSIPAPPQMTPEQLASAKNQLRSDAYASMGMAGYKKKDYATAEQNFAKALEVFPENPDKEYTMLRLTVSLDKQQKYPEALEWAKKTQAAASVKPGSPVTNLANQEVTRLTGLVNAPKKAPAAAPSAPAPIPVTPK